MSLRARVVKINHGILKRNWIHLRDGTGDEHSGHLSATSTDGAKVGDVVKVIGILHLNRDFGLGYVYPLLLENAKVTVEKSAK